MVKDVDLNAHDAWVTFTFVSARGLHHHNGKVPFPFIKLSTETENDIFHTKHGKNATDSPAWNETYRANQHSDQGEYKIGVWNKGWITDDFLGFFAILKKDIRLDMSSVTEFQLHPRPGKTDHVSGFVTVGVAATRKTIQESIGETMNNVGRMNFLYMNLQPGASANTLLQLAQSIGVQLHMRSQQSGHTVSLLKQEEFTRNVQSQVYQNGQMVTVNRSEVYFEEFVAQVTALSTAVGQIYVQVSYTNPHRHGKFTSNWENLCRSLVNSALSSGLLNTNPALKTVVGATDQAQGSCVIQ